jgi:hypothetical protein
MSKKRLQKITRETMSESLVSDHSKRRRTMPSKDDKTTMWFDDEIQVFFDKEHKEALMRILAYNDYYEREEQLERDNAMFLKELEGATIDLK